VVVGTGPQLAAANGLNAFSGSVLRLTAPVLGALLLSGPGIRWVVVIDVASYLVAAGLIARLGRRVPASPAGISAGASAGLRAGLTHVAHSPLLRGPLIGNGVFLTANAALTTLLVPFVTGPLNAPGADVGYLISGLGAGFVLGSAASRLLLDRFSTRLLLSLAQLANGIAYFALFNAPTPATAVAAAALIGVPGSVLLISVETHVQRTAPPDMIGRVGSLFFAMDSLAAVTGAGFAPALVAAFGLAPALDIISAAALLASPLTWTLSPT